MSLEAISWVLRHSKSKGAARLVLLSIANHADGQGLASWPSLYTVRRESGVSLRQIKRSLSQLVEISELEINRGASPKGTNVYILPLFHGFSTEEDRMALPMTPCVIYKRRGRFASRMTGKQRELWSELHVGTGPQA